MPKQKPNDSMTAAECARRTGITVKALRVYERHGLIKPARSGKGWRLYGPQELLRLHAIAALKSLGLTLAQIRNVFGTSSPPLERVLHIQRDAWRARKAAAERALDLVDAALARFSARGPLSVDDLCDLLRNLEMDTVQSIGADLLKEMFTLDEQWQWVREYGRLSKEQLASKRESFDASRAIALEFRKLLEQGVEPGSRKAQALLKRSNESWLKHGVRQQLLERLESDPVMARKIYRFGNRLMERSTMPDRAEEGRLNDYIVEIRAASEHGRAIDRLVEQAKTLCVRDQNRASPSWQKVASRFAEICRQHSLGDPVVCARWSCEFGKHKYRGKWQPLDVATRTAWQRLAEASVGSDASVR